MDGTNANTSNRKVEEEREGESSRKKLKVTLGVKTLDCPICFEPLSPPIFQCSVGHFICWPCCAKQDKKCPVCSIETSFNRCFGMEHVVHEAKVACSNDKYGCAEMVTYYKKEEHKACLYAPCFCPESGCGFAGPTKLLLDHFTTQHKCPSTTLPDSGVVSLRLQPALHVLRCTDFFFLLIMASEPLGHAISVICVQPNVKEPKFKCTMEYDCITTSCCESTNCHIRSSSLSDGLPTVYDLIIPRGKIFDDGNGIMLRATILSIRANGLTPDLQGMPYTKTAIAASVPSTTAAAAVPADTAAAVPATTAAAVPAATAAVLATTAASVPAAAAAVPAATAAAVPAATVAAADTSRRERGGGQRGRVLLQGQRGGQVQWRGRGRRL